MILGTGECAAFVAEQLGLDQLAGYRRHVERHHRVRRPGAVPMQGPGHQFLAGARCPLDHDRDVRLGQSTDRPEDLLHGARLANDVGNIIVMTCLRGALLAAHQHRATDGGDCFVDVERLRQVLERACLVGTDGTVQVRVGGHDDHRQLGMTIRQDG